MIFSLNSRVTNSGSCSDVISGIELSRMLNGQHCRLSTIYRRKLFVKPAQPGDSETGLRIMG
jgi:hypothetical protein